MKLSTAIVGLALLLSVVGSLGMPPPPWDKQLHILKTKATAKVVKELKKLADHCRRCYTEEVVIVNISNSVITVIKQNFNLFKEVVDEFYHHGGHPAMEPASEIVYTAFNSDEVQQLVTEVLGGKMDPTQKELAYEKTFDKVYVYVKSVIHQP